MNQTSSIISTDPGAPDQDEADEFGVQAEFRQVRISVTQHGARIDRAMVEVAPEFSRSYLQQLIEAGLVRLNGAVVTKPSAKVKAEDCVAVELRPTPQSQSFMPEHIPLDIVFEDEYLAIVNKPAGMVVHPAPGNWRGTLLNALLDKYPQSVQVPRAGIVHRLDKDTSGLMVVAKSRLVMDALVQAIAARQVHRKYLAVGHGDWAGNEPVQVNQPIGRDPRNRLRMAVVYLVTTPGKLAATDITKVASVADATLVMCKLHTGRTHQIRVHMAYLGHSLVADTVYGGLAMGGMSRQALHAFALSFEHPILGGTVAVTCSPPADFELLLSALGLRYNLATLP